MYPSDLVRTKNWGTEVLTDSDIEEQLDLIINWIMAALHSITGHDHSGVANRSPKINATASLIIASQAQGDILYAVSAVAFARLAAGTAGDILKSGGVGANPSWLTVLPVANGGTGATAAANAANGVIILNGSAQIPALSGALLTNLPAQAPTQVNDTDAGTGFNATETTFLSVAKTITSGKTVILVASGDTTFGSLETSTIRLYQGTTLVQTVTVTGAHTGVGGWSCNGIVTGLSGSITFSVTAQNSNNNGRTAGGNLVVLEF